MGEYLKRFVSRGENPSIEDRVREFCTMPLLTGVKNIRGINAIIKAEQLKAPNNLEYFSRCGNRLTRHAAGLCDDGDKAKASELEKRIDKLQRLLTSIAWSEGQFPEESREDMQHQLAEGLRTLDDIIDLQSKAVERLRKRLKYFQDLGRDGTIRETEKTKNDPKTFQLLQETLEINLKSKKNQLRAGGLTEEEIADVTKDYGGNILPRDHEEGLAEVNGVLQSDLGHLTLLKKIRTDYEAVIIKREPHKGGPTP
jgi:hypothetical protein